MIRYAFLLSVKHIDRDVFVILLRSKTTMFSSHISGFSTLETSTSALAAFNLIYKDVMTERRDVSIVEKSNASARLFLVSIAPC